jgi:hypothetical protein
MIKWIDIVSARLKAYHQRWVQERGASMIPHVRKYNSVLPILPTNESAVVMKVSGQDSPIFRQVGIRLGPILQGCEGGMKFIDITPSARRTSVTLPFIRVMRSHQPDCRRGSFRRGSSTREYEQLLLPFCNDHMQVCLVHAVFDLGQ